MEEEEEIARQIEANFYGGPHKHCFSCYSYILCDKSEDACEFAKCQCGAIFHACKTEEHLLLV